MLMDGATSRPRALTRLRDNALAIQRRTFGSPKDATALVGAACPSGVTGAGLANAALQTEWLGGGKMEPPPLALCTSPGLTSMEDDGLSSAPRFGRPSGVEVMARTLMEEANQTGRSHLIPIMIRKGFGSAFHRPMKPLVVRINRFPPPRRRQGRLLCRSWPRWASARLATRSVVAGLCRSGGSGLVAWQPIDAGAFDTFHSDGMIAREP